jgi:Tol biopolymer transport system component
LFLLSIADGSSVRLASDFKDARLPVWSSDGRYILFTGCRTGDQPMPACSEWWVTSRDGKTVQNSGSLALLRREKIQPIDEIGGWYRDMVLFSARRGTTTSLWELAMPRASLKGEGKPRQLTSGTRGRLLLLSHFPLYPKRVFVQVDSPNQFTREARLPLLALDRKGRALAKVVCRDCS